MSQVTKGLVVEDARTNFDLEKLQVFSIGGKNVNYLSQVFPDIRGTSPGSVSVNISLANTQALVRQCYFHFRGTFTVKIATNTGGAVVKPVLAGQLALSQNAFYKIVSSIQLSLGSYSTQWQNVSQTVDMINSLRRNTRCDWGYLSADSELMDCATNFQDLAGSSRDIFSDWQSSTINGYSQAARASRITILTNGDSADDDTPGTCTVEFDLYVPVLMQPLYGAEEARQAFVRCNTINLTINFASNMDNFISYNDKTILGETLAPPAQVAATSTASKAVNDKAGGLSFQDKTVLEFCYQTIDIGDIPGGVPLQCYNTNQWVYQAQSATLAKGDNQITLNQFSFSTQPSVIMIAVIPNDKYTSGCSTPTWYAAPTGQINMNYIDSNVLNIPSNMSKVTYDICLKNGINMDYPQWSSDRIVTAFPSGVFAAGTTARRLGGGFLVFTPSDLRSAKTPDTAPGTVSPYSSGYTLSGNFTVNVTAAGAYQVVILACIPYMLREVSFANFVQENITPAGLELHKMVDASTNVHHLMKESELYGAGFFSFIKDLGKKVARGVTKGYDFVKDHAGTIEKYAEKALPYLEQEIPFVGAPLSAATKFALDHKDAIAKIARAVKGATGGGVELDGDVIGQMLGCGLDENDIKELVTKVSEDPNKYLEESEVTRSKLATDGLSRFVNLRQKLRL